MWDEKLYVFIIGYLRQVTLTLLVSISISKTIYQEQLGSDIIYVNPQHLGGS